MVGVVIEIIVHSGDHGSVVHIPACNRLDVSEFEL
jgi:hypothetical protein